MILRRGSGLSHMAPPRSTIVFDVGELAGADIATVDALARLQLACGRLGLEIRLRHAAPDLVRLLDLAGLAAVLGVEPGGQAEKGEQRGRIEEERELDDPAP
jgi:hypothetical protein